MKTFLILLGLVTTFPLFSPPVTAQEAHFPNVFQPTQPSEAIYSRQAEFLFPQPPVQCANGVCSLRSSNPIEVQAFTSPGIVSSDQQFSTWRYSAISLPLQPVLDQTYLTPAVRHQYIRIDRQPFFNQTPAAHRISPRYCDPVTGRCYGRRLRQ